MSQGLSNNQILYRNASGNFIFNREVGGKNYGMVVIPGFNEGKAFIATRALFKTGLKTEYGGGRFAENMPDSIANLLEQDIKVGIEALSFTYNPDSNRFGGTTGSPWSPTNWDTQKLETLTIPTVGSGVGANVWYGVDNTVTNGGTGTDGNPTDPTDRSATTTWEKVQAFVKDNPILVGAIVLLIAAVVYFVWQNRAKEGKMKDLQVQLSTAKGKDKKQLQAEYQRLLAA